MIIIRILAQFLPVKTAIPTIRNMMPKGRNISSSTGTAAVTDRAVHFAGKAYPLTRIVQIRPGHYSNSVVLSVKQFPELPSQNIQMGTLDAPIAEVELKSSNVKALTHSIESASSAHG